MTDMILFVQQPAFNHPLLYPLYFSPLFLSPTLFSRCSWQWRGKDFLGNHSSSRPPLLLVSESLPLLRARPGYKRLPAPYPWLFFVLFLQATFSYSVYSSLIEITTCVTLLYITVLHTRESTTLFFSSTQIGI